MSRRDWTLLVADTRTVDAVVRNLEILGEASTGIPLENKLLNPEIDWAAIKGLRNRIVHEYFGLSLSVIWAIVKHDPPVLTQQLCDWRRET
jgi:uncharacterized protein with HEPN domain